MSLAEGLRRAAALHARGDLAGARRQAESVLKSHPEDPTALQFLGVVHCQSGDAGRGAELLERALRRSPADANVRLNLARAYADSGQLEKAERICRPAGGAAQSPDLLRMRADVLKAQGRWGDAIGCYEQLLAAQPRDFGSWNNLGNARQEAGDPEGALVALKQAARLNPANATVHLNLARLLAGTGRGDEAAAELQAAVRLAGNDARILVEVGKTLQSLGRGGDALLPLGAAARLEKTNPEIFVLIGLAFASVPDLRQAEQGYRVAIQVDRRHAPAYLNLAILLEQGNRVEELEQLLDRARAEGLAGGEIDYVAALVFRRRGELEQAMRLAEGAVSPSLDPAVRAQFIGQVADRLGLVDAAFAAFSDMNAAIAAQPAAAAIDRSAPCRFVDGLSAVTTAEWVASWREATPAIDPPAPAFLVGFMRSGTTLLDTILMGHPGTHVLEEDPILARVEAALGGLDRLAALDESGLDQLRARYFSELAAIGPVPAGKLIVDKNPLATLRAPLIHRIFPDGKFIFALRHPCDVVLSCFMQYFRASESTAPFWDLGDAARYYARAMSYWEQCRGILPLQVHTVRYEDLVDDVEAEVRPLLEFLGLAWDEKVLDHQRTASERGHIRTPSYAQVTERIYKRSSGRWTRYREHMSEALPILAPWVEKFGYSLD